VSNPSLRFYYSKALHKKTLAVIKTIRKAKDPTAHRAELADIVVELTSSGIDYYFMNSLKASKAGFLMQQTANLGLAGTMQVIGSVIRNVISYMDGPQLVSVCGSIEQLML
jgi:hypothetical protein